MNREYVICLGRREKVLDALKNEGYRTIVVVDKALSLPNKHMCDYVFHVEDISSYNEVMKNINDLLHLNIISVIALSEKAMITSAHLRKELNISGHSFNDVEKFTDKFLMKCYAVDNEIEVAEFIQVLSFEQGSEFINQLHQQNKSVIAKPRDGLGTVDVVKISPGEDSLWKEYYQKYLNNKNKYYFNNGIILEEFIEGEEYHIDTLIQNGEVLFSQPSKYLKNNLGFQSHKLVGSISLNEEYDIYQELISFNKDIVEAFKIDYGTTHMECFVCDDGRIVLNEIALRPAGNSIPEMLSDSFIDFDFYRLFVKIECFVSVEIKKVQNVYNYYGYVHIPVIQAGTIKKLIDAEDLINHNCVYRVEYNAKVNDVVGSIDYSNEKIGVIFGKSNNFAVLRDELEKAVKVASNYHIKN